MIKEDYVSFEVAKLLKEKGFAEKCISYYSQCTTPEKLTFGGKVNYNNDSKWNFKMCPPVSAPTHQMAMKWLREIYNTYIVITAEFSLNADDDITYHYDIWTHPDKYTVNHNHYDGRFISNEEAVEAALKYALINLI